MSGSISKEKAESNTEVLKMLLKLPGNKYCSDCKRNDHPRWASWSLGIFLCIRCSGIHRSMGTHISRVKSVDLDSWTNEQLENMIRWGNERANKYWEAKLIPGHIPSESKIDNYIRTKYETKRWVMDGPIPDPSTFDECTDNEIIHNIVSSHVLDKNSASSVASKAAKQVYTKEHQILGNLFPFSEKKEAPLHHHHHHHHHQNLSRQNPIKSKEPLFKSNLKNHSNILEFHESQSSNTHEKSSRANLKTSILSLYSTTSTSQPNILSKSLVKDTCLPEDQQTSKHESLLLDNSKDISKSLQDLGISDEQKIFHTSSSESSHQFSNPAVSYLLNTQKFPSVSASHDITAMKDKTSRTSRNPSYSKGISSNDKVFDSESPFIKSFATDAPKIFPTPDKDSSSKQWDSDSLTFSSFQPSNFFTDSDTLSFHTSPWSIDEPKEIQRNPISYQKDVLHKDDVHDKNVLFYDDSIISTTDVWK
ncbi:hypothetical protein T552_03352 [Pneumocystis carinii B80]|uniref:Arf-GAP domain-containing protein n=1 Tax=Pneumocystis carinii (strain B80) TaxID=1408658 RepID=A0A0W4ZBH0_PNEC8|nr:hypothetical protein T552_03352 [Pneumocystis carinii B80]KTW25739.1 hypothetical protein T552_03352 [Pneumocystis carinii B80]